jgi:ankyrin repeat protein/protein-L-isoaspartate O-methyltransferase
MMAPMKKVMRLTSLFTALLGMAACVFVTASVPCFGQADRETWQPPEKILDAIGVKPGMRVGEAGAGRGYFTFPLARRVGPGGAVFANDISTSSLDVIRERVDSEGLKNIKVVEGAVEDPLFPEKNLDVIVMVYVLHMLERPIPFVKNLRSYLKPGGVLVIIERNTTVDRVHSPSFMTNRQILETLTGTGYALDRTETFLPRDTIYIYKMSTPSSAPAGEIHEAVAAGDLDTVRALIEADAALLESRDGRGNTPLISACAPLTRQVAVANLLLDEGASVNVSNKRRDTPLQWASFSLPGQDSELELIQRLVDKGADVNAQGYNGITPLHRAVQLGNIKVADLLIDHGADPNAYDKYSGAVGPSDISGTVLQVAINLSPSEEMAKWLVERGAKPNRKDSNGNTELHLAALKGYADLTRLLVGRGADVHAVNEYGRTALCYAAKHGYRSVADALIAAGAKESAVVEANYGKAPQLTATLKEGEAYLWYFGFLGYAVKTKGHLLLFNPQDIDESMEAGLANGHLNPNELAGLRVTVLITEPERRRYGPRAVELVKRIPGVSFVFSYMPAASSAGTLDASSYRLATPNVSFFVGGIQVHPIPAMGGGMGYLVEADGVKVLHAGLHVSGNVPSELDEYRKEIEFLKPFGPIDVAILSVFGHNNRVGTAYEPYIYLLDQLSPKAVYLLGANNPEQYPRCVEVLRARGIPVAYPEGGRAKGERFHYLRERASATAAAPASAIKPPQGTKP